MADQAVTQPKKRSSLGKKLGIAFLVIVLIVVGVIALAISQVNTIVKKGVEEGGTYALGTKTTLTGADIGLFSGKVGLTGLTIANAPGFKSPEFFSLGDGAVEVTLPSLMKDVVEVPLIRFSAIRMNLEKKDGKTNYNVILDNLKKVTGDSSGAAPKTTTQPKSGDEKKFIVKSIQIRDVKVHVDLLGMGGSADQLAEVNVPIDEVVLANVGTAENGGVDLQTLASVIVNAVLGAVADKGGNLPPEFLNDLKGQLADLRAQLSQVRGLKGATLGAARAIGENLKEDVKKAVESVDVEAAKKAAEDAAKKAKETGKEAVDTIKGLIPTKRKEPPK